MNLPQINIKYTFIVGSILASLVLLDSFYFDFKLREYSVKWSSGTEIRTISTIHQKLSHDDASEYLLNTELCKIPRTDIMPEYFKDIWKVEKIPDCDYEKVIAEVADDGVLELLPEYRHTNCCIQEIVRNVSDDMKYGLTRCEPVDWSVNTQHKETYVLRCSKSMKFEANLLVPPKVQEKIDYWRNRDEDLRPISVLFMGFDTVSRSHAFRSLSKTLKLMAEMGFHDFVGYHSVAPSTLTNFMAFLMGMKRTEVRRTCTPNWSSPFDACPLIWKNYSQHNYVTMYVEDGIQTFNWGGQSGFIERPTDYYLHNFFNAVEDIRIQGFQYYGYKNDLRTTQLRGYCTSTETVPQFSIRYLRRFIRKFEGTPFFAFTWFAYPYHEYGFALGDFEDELLAFFNYLKASPSILRNSLIVFNADHGERDGFFKSKGVEGYIERGLPPLFIRLPERLLEKYPDMNLNEAMRTNTQHLVSPFDLHHTFLHLLSLSEMNLTMPDGKEFEPVLPNRASLLLPIGETKVRRDCQNLNIFPDSCVCNTLVNIETIENPYYLGQISTVLQDRLRSMVVDSGYGELCAEWSVKTGSVISAQVVSKEDKSTINIIRFEANPGGANFEAKVRIAQNNSNFDSCEIIGSLNRINLYGDQSSCVGSKTDGDKEMKAFCMCKSQVEENKYGF